MAKNERTLVGLDIGTSNISCVVARAREDDDYEIIGVGGAPSRGLRKGVVVNLESTVASIKQAVEEAEMMAGTSIDSAIVGIAGGHIRSFNSRGVVAVTARDRTVSQDDVDRVIDAARAVSIPQDREILHVLPQEFVLDDQRGISSPVGLTGARLEVNVHIITAASTSLQNLVSCTNRAGIEVSDTVLEQLALSEAVLSDDEKDLGVASIDIGGGTTDLAIFEAGSIWHTAVLPVGGDHFTNDLAVGLRTPTADAERIKRMHGCALAALVEGDDPIEVPPVGHGKARLLSRQVMAEILQPRAEELFNLLRDEIGRAGFDRALSAGIVLTGGGSLLPGVVEVAEQVFDLPVRQGRAQGADAFAGDSENGPLHATAIGLVRFGARHAMPTFQRDVPSGVSVLGRMTGAVRGWFSEVF